MMPMHFKVTFIPVYGTEGDVNAFCNDITVGEYAELVRNAGFFSWLVTYGTCTRRRASVDAPK